MAEGEAGMKITDLTITLHRWDVPKTVYHGEVGGTKEVGVVTIVTDEGVEGHAFLGSSNQGADEFAQQVLTRLARVAGVAEWFDPHQCIHPGSKLPLFSPVSG